MSMTRLLLAIDSFINLLLGSLLVFFPVPLAEILGVPIPDSAFYPSILGGVLLGIGIALAMEYSSPRERLDGLGLGGAIAINMSGGAVLATWLIWGGIDIPLRGNIFLWTITLLLIGISAFELIVRAQTHDNDKPT